MSRDVGRVVVVLASGVDQHEVALCDRATVLDVVKDRRVLARADEPQRPEDLAGHNCLIYTYRAARNDWRLVDAAGEESVFTVSGNLETNNPMMLRAAALAGLGIVLLPLWIIGPDIKAGRLQRVLPDYHWPDSAIHAVYPPGRHLAARVRSFVDFLVERFAE